jgi:hypothetical protein
MDPGGGQEGRGFMDFLGNDTWSMMSGALESAKSLAGTALEKAKEGYEKYSPTLIEKASELSAVALDKASSLSKAALDKSLDAAKYMSDAAKAKFNEPSVVKREDGAEGEEAEEIRLL